MDAAREAIEDAKPLLQQAVKLSDEVRGQLVLYEGAAPLLPLLPPPPRAGSGGHGCRRLAPSPLLPPPVRAC